MGGNWYSRSNMGMFEVPKPLSTLGIGVDQISEEIKTSKVLTGNDLGKLGNIESLPTEEEVAVFVSKNMEVRKTISTFEIEKKHTLAQKYLTNGDVLSAWKVLLAKI